MTDLELERATAKVEQNKEELREAISEVEQSLKETSQKVGRYIEEMKKYPGLGWAVAGAICATVLIDFFAKQGSKISIDSP